VPIRRDAMIAGTYEYSIREGAMLKSNRYKFLGIESGQSNDEIIIIMYNVKYNA